MKCMNECGSEATGKSQYCSKSCRAIASRKRSAAPVNEAQQSSAAPGPEFVPNEKVYGRPAVRYDLSEPWALRPEPDNPDDVPVLDNRGMYKRPDGSAYQIDAVGTAHSIDYDGRRKNRTTLQAWAKDKSAQRQQVMGQLSLTYNKSLDMNDYLGVST